MTCIAGIVERGHVMLAGDSALTLGDDEQWCSRDAKVWRIGEWVVGACGGGGYCDMMRHALKLPAVGRRGFDARLRIALPLAVRAAADRAKLPAGEMARALVGLRGRLYMLDSELGIHRPRMPWYAIGSGGMVAMGALYAAREGGARERLLGAMRAAAALCQGVAPPFRTVST